MGEIVQFTRNLERVGLIRSGPRGEEVRFVARSERERSRLIREARAIYDSIFPSADPLSSGQDRMQGSHLATSTSADRSDGILS
jgi:hypothetical protein